MAFGKNLMGSFTSGVPRKLRQQLPTGFGGMVDLPISGALEMNAFSKRVDMPTISERKTLVPASARINTDASEMFTANQSNASTDPVMNRGMTFKSALDARLGNRMASARRAQEDAARGATANTVVYRRS
tara:strand:- start:74 stop:463 length:390 start_codon:yes stop_codon:yes gene_type:complete